MPASLGTMVAVAQLKNLQRLREMGMRFAERLDRRAAGLGAVQEQNALECDLAAAFAKVSRAVRHIIVLEGEVLGLRPVPIPRAAPAWGGLAVAGVSDRGFAEPARPVRETDRERRERSDLYDRNDYDKGPIDGVIAAIRATFSTMDARWPAEDAAEDAAEDMVDAAADHMPAPAAVATCVAARPRPAAAEAGQPADTALAELRAVRLRLMASAASPALATGPPV